MYSEEQSNKALVLYGECGFVTKAITQLGCPTMRHTLYNWITRRKHLLNGCSSFHGFNTPEHPRHPSLELNLNALHHCFELGENVQSVSDEIYQVLERGDNRTFVKSPKTYHRVIMLQVYNQSASLKFKASPNFER